MKSFNKYISILNIINIILVMVIYIIQDFIIYETAKEILSLMYYIIAGFNIILAIVNLLKKNRKIGSVQILTGIIMLAGTIIASYEASILMQCFVSIIVFVLSIINLIFNKRVMTIKKGKVAGIIFAIILVFELVIVIIPVTLNIMNLKNLENAISKIVQDGKEETYIYSKDNRNIIIGEDGKKISENEYDISYYPIQLQIENQTINLRYAIDNKNKLYIINSKGEKLFEIYNLFDDPEKIISNFFSLVVGNNIFNITNPTNEIGYKEYIEKSKSLKTYTGDIDMSEFEEENAEYKYFSNEEISDKILQVVIKKDEKETNSELYNNYLESNIIVMSDYSYDKYDALTTKLEEFYNYKKEYYLLDINSNNKIKLECNNLLYRIYYNEKEELQEDILIYSNGYIPYYDTDNSGYFDQNGKKIRINNKYLIQDMTENYQIIINKSTAKSYIYNRQTGKIEKEYENFKIYNNFYVSYNSENDEYEIINKNNLEVMAISEGKEPQIYKDTIIICSEENQDKCYYYNGEGLELVDDCTNFNSFEKNVYSTNYLLSGEDDSVYAKMGIIYKDDR